MEEIKCEQVGQLVGSGFTEMTGRVYSIDGLTPSIRTFSGGNTEVKIAEPIIYGDYNDRVRADQDCIGTLTTNCGNDALRNGVKIIERIIVDECLQQYRIRKFTEKECFRLMGVKENDFKRVATKQSTSSLYHLAGDSIVTSCLMGIFGSLLGIDYQQKIDNLVKELRTTKI